MGVYLFTSTIILGAVFVVTNYRFYSFLYELELYDCYNDANCHKYLKNFSIQKKKENNYY